MARSWWTGSCAPCINIVWGGVSHRACTSDHIFGAAYRVPGPSTPHAADSQPARGSQPERRAHPHPTTHHLNRDITSTASCCSPQMNSAAANASAQLSFAGLPAAGMFEKGLRTVQEWIGTAPRVQAQVCTVGTHSEHAKKQALERSKRGTRGFGILTIVDRVCCHQPRQQAGCRALDAACGGREGLCVLCIVYSNTARVYAA